MAAARVVLFGILFTEVLQSACAAGVKGVGSSLSGKNGSKTEGHELDLARNSGVSFVAEPKGDIIIGRRSVTVACSAGTNNVTWLYNGVLAPPCGPIKCSLLHNGSLRFYKKKNTQVSQKHKVQDSSETSKADEYRCIARTNFGGLLRSSAVHVHVAEIARGFRESPKNVKIREGEVARFACSINSVPLLPNVTWLHNGKELKIDSNNTKYYIIPPGVLYINSVKLSDAGSYSCLATNEFLNKTKRSKEAKLIVSSKFEDVDDHKPSFLFPQTSYNYSLLNGSSILLACAASGFPAQGTVWSFVPRQTDAVQPLILSNSTSSINVLKLENVSVSDAGYYLCSFANNNSENYQNVTITVLVPPNIVKKPTNQVCPNGRTARFECQAQGLPIPRIYWFKDAENITIKGRRTVYEREFNMVELAISATVPSDSGVYQCVAVNEAGEVWAAGRLQVNTSRNSPTALTSLQCRALSPVRMLISWEPPKYLPHTSITAYTVHYISMEGGKEEVSPPEPGNSTSVEVTKLLEPYTNYSFYVRVWNNYGPSNQSATIVCATAPSVPKTAPKIKLDVISSTKLNVTWEPLTKREAQGIIVAYKLQWRLHQSPAIRVQELPADVEHFVLKDLIPGEQYDVHVLARTEQGWPNISESSFNWTTVTMPDENQFDLDNRMEINVINFNATTIKISWRKKDHAHNHIVEMFDSWEIYFENLAGDKILSFVLPKNTSEYLVQDLRLSAAYTIGLCMKNNDNPVGCLVESIKSKHNSLTNVPTGLEATPISSSSIHLKWTTLNVQNESLYEVCYYPVQTAIDTVKCINTTKPEITIDKLKPFTLYQFKVRTLGNNNLFSETIECYTKEDIPGKVEGVQWFLMNGTTIRVVWKEPSTTNGLIQKYQVSYTSNLFETVTNWNSFEVSGNQTFVDLPSFMTGRRYFITVQASTKAGYGKRSDPIVITTGGPPSKIPTSSDERKPPLNIKSDQSLGIILGVGISVVFITVCLCSMYCRRKCETSRLLRHSAQARKMRVLPRDGNGCCIERASTSASQYNVSINKSGNEIELAVLCPVTPVTNQHMDTKGTANGVAEPCAKEPLLLPWEANGDCKDIRITQCPEYKQSELVVASTAITAETSEAELNSTQLTLVNCSLRASNSSLNNNLACAMSEAALEKMSYPAPVPILGPNG